MWCLIVVCTIIKTTNMSISLMYFLRRGWALKLFGGLFVSKLIYANITLQRSMLRVYVFFIGKNGFIGLRHMLMALL